MMEAARTSETSVDNYFTWQSIPEDKSELHNSVIPKISTFEYIMYRKPQSMEAYIFM
jgi:hypothetical protein